jgi:dipeptidyl aminopeptidase/acylaminoacyl peptidase
MNNLQLKIIFFIVGCLLTNESCPQAQTARIDLLSDENKLNAEIHVSQGDQPRPTLILMHGYPGGEGDPFGLGKTLSSTGINVLIFNYQGTWSSEGTFSFESSIRDVTNALKFLRADNNIEKFHIDTSNIIIGGYSYGGGIALTAAIHNKDVRRIISIAGADESVMGRKWIADSVYRNSLETYLRTTIYPQGPIKCDFDAVIKAWLGNLDYYDQVKHAEYLVNKDILLLGGWHDESCLVEEIIIPLYRRLHELDAENVKIKVFDTDHSFHNVRGELTETIYNWIMDGI